MSSTNSSISLTTTGMSGGMVSSDPTSVTAPISTQSSERPSQNITASPTYITPVSSPSPMPTYNPRSAEGASTQTLLAIVGITCLIIATIYTIQVIRSDCRRRRLDRDGSSREPESGNGGRYASTYRPEDEDTTCPPYRVYGHDQPYIDPEMVVVYPDMVLLHSSNAPGLLSSQQGLTGITSIMTPGNVRDLYIPIPITTTATTITTTTTTTASSSPVIAAPSPVFTLTAGRYQSIIRHGLPGSNNIHNAGSFSSTLQATLTGRCSTVPSLSASTDSASISPGLYGSEQGLLSVPTAGNQGSVGRSSELQPERSSMAEHSGNSRSGILQPILNRLRSQGPPPYIPMASEETAPQLPPEYGATDSQ
ncbi:hypothetical protein BGX27_008492 [Mortierella sp. AM989]|nr:hypothetical protein BGX27_008492 [Mortierella sp. AM989]